MLQSLKWGHITFFPVVPGKVEFAAEVRRRLLADAPDMLAVELPLSMRGLYAQAIRQLPELSVITRPDQLDPDRKLYIPVEPTDPFVEALRTARELGIDVTFIEPDCGDRPHLPDLYPDTFAVRTLGVEAYVEAYREQLPEPTEEIEEHASAMAWKLQGSNPERRLLAIVSLNLVDAVLSAIEAPQAPPLQAHSSARRHMTLRHLDPGSLADNTVEMPPLMERYEHFRHDCQDAELINRREVQQHLLREAELSYVTRTGCAALQDWQRALVAKFARNLALSSGGLAPTLLDLIAAAQAVVDDDYASEVRNLASQYRPQKPSSGLRTLSLAQGAIWDRRQTLILRPRMVPLVPRDKSATQWPAPLKQWLSVDPILGSHAWDTIVVVLDEDRADPELTDVHSSPWGGSYSNSGRLGGLMRLAGVESDENLWTCPAYDAAESKGERLLLAALCRSCEQRVVYISPVPPRPLMKSVAAHLERKIMYVPLGQVPPNLIRQILDLA
jgi:hypothetical protein